jgi:EpsI family protein
MTPQPVKNDVRLRVPTARVGLALFFIVATQGVLLAASFLLFPSQIRPARQKLQALPMTFNDWTGVETEIDHNVIGALGAHDMLGRVYSRADGSRVNVHVASWNGGGEWTPHPPELCYAGNGWKMLSRTRSKPFDDDKSVAELQSHEKVDNRVFVTYWYQIGPIAYYNRDGARIARRQYMGQTVRPPLYKVMLQTSNLGNDSHSTQVEELAQAVKSWIAQQ